MLYEINYLVLQSKTSDLEKIREEMKKVIESFDAKITAEREYLKRKLSYEINHERHGFFTVLRFEIKDNGQIKELKKNLNISEYTDRYIIVRADELPSLEEHAQKEADVQRKDTLKQEEVEQVLAEEARKTPASKTEKTETAPAKEEVKEEIKEEVKKETEEKVIEEVEVKKDKKVIEKKEAEEVKEETSENPSKETDEKEADKKEQKDKVSLDELDKKLDEILNL